MKLGLGTVQFGLDYGIANPAGKMSFAEAEAVLTQARKAGMDLLDTAPAYGNSEQVIGTILPRPCDMKIVTKTPQFDKARLGAADAGSLTATFRESLARLQSPAVYGLLIHQPEDLLAEGGEALFDAMLRLKSAHLVDRIGVSIYSGGQIDRILERFDIDLIQLPLSVLDQRLRESGHVAALKGRGIEIHVRSVFLQGLLLMEPGRLAPRFDALKPGLEAYRAWLTGHHLSPVQGALAFLRQTDGIDYAIVGVNSACELRELLDAWSTAIPAGLDFAPFACREEKFVNPALWTRPAS